MTEAKGDFESEWSVLLRRFRVVRVRRRAKVRDGTAKEKESGVCDFLPTKSASRVLRNGLLACTRLFYNEYRTRGELQR